VRIDCVGASRKFALQEPPVGEGSGPRAALLDVFKSGNCILTVNIYFKSAFKKKSHICVALNLNKRQKTSPGPVQHREHECTS
jgi:hypothetical protein